MTTTENPYKEKVLAGAAYLDAVRPGWAEKINLDTLDLGKSSYCVIGQSVDRYMDGIQELGLSTDEAIALGFNSPKTSEFEALTAAWKPVIAERQPKPERFEAEVYNGSVLYTIREAEDGLSLHIKRFSQGLVVATDDREIWRQIGEAILDAASS
jgi:hypothetical protein